MTSEEKGAKVLLVLGHGRETSLCHHLASLVEEELASAGAEVRVHDLLRDGFDPVLRLAPDQRHAGAVSEAEDAVVHRYQEDVRWADGYGFVHPVWWFAPPAILKGWIDRVLVDGVAIRQLEQGPPQPLLEGRHAFLIQTFNAPSLADRVVFRGMATGLWKRIVLRSIGVRLSARVALYDVEGITADRLEAQRKRLKRAVRVFLGALES